MQPRVVTLDASRIADFALLHGMKAQGARYDAADDPVPPTPHANPPTTTTNTTNPSLPYASLPTIQTGSVPASLRAELEELLGVDLPQPLDAGRQRGQGGAPSNAAPTAAALQELLEGGTALTGRAASRAMRELEVAEVAAQGPNASYRTALARLQKLRPRHYAGPIGALRRARLWFRVNGGQVASGIAVVLLVGGLATLCVFCPVAGIIVAVYAVLVLGAGGAQAAASGQ